jgi:hypothetical protein
VTAAPNSPERGRDVAVPDATVLPFPDRDREVAERPETAADTYDTSFEVALDDDPAPATPVLVDTVAKARDDRAPIIPTHLRTLPGVRRTATRVAVRTGHRIGYHAVRSPLYAVLAAWWAVVGLFRLVGRQLAWWWVLESHALRQLAAARACDSAIWGGFRKAGLAFTRMRAWAARAWRTSGGE